MEADFDLEKHEVVREKQYGNFKPQKRITELRMTKAEFLRESEFGRLAQRLRREPIIVHLSDMDGTKYVNFLAYKMDSEDEQS